MNEHDHLWLPAHAETHGGEFDVRHVYCVYCREVREL